MSELVRWSDRPQAPVIRISHPHPRPCWAAQCTVPAAVHVLSWDRGITIYLDEACVGHAEALKPYGIVVFPLDGAPPMSVLGECFAAELAKRSARVQFVQQYWAPGVYVNNTGAFGMFTTSGWSTG